MRILIILLLLLTSSLAEAQLIQNGDVNGDGNRDVGDVVYLLSHLFQSGPEPVDIPARLPLMDVASADARYVNNGDGTWTDTWTNLMWITGAYYWQNWDGYNSPEEYFNGISYANHTDWRLPTPDEVMGLYPWGAPVVYSCGQNINFSPSGYDLSPIWGEWRELINSALPQGTWPYTSQFRQTVDHPWSSNISSCAGGDTQLEWHMYFYPLDQQGDFGPPIGEDPWRSYFTNPAGVAVRDSN